MGDKTVLAFGSLLHDIGKVVYRGSSGAGTHSVLGAAFLSDEIAPVNASFASGEGRAVIEQVRYHHKDEMRHASLPRDSLAFITYFADNVSAGMDRKTEGDEKGRAVFDKDVDLRKIFNIVRGRKDDNVIPHDDYNVIREQIKLQLLQTHISSLEVNSLLNCLEATCSTVPSSTNLSELVDVSLYDHAKTTAGIASCIYDYLREAGVIDYEYALFGKGASSYYGKSMFLLCSYDMSGIQDFIYNISGSGALKQLRARSLYLEMLLEHVVDELLERLELSRTNLLYTGGGHAYLLLPNTSNVKDELELFQTQLKGWFLEHYGTDLFLASAWVECSAEDLMNKGRSKQRFLQLFRDLSSKMSAAKALRYTAEDIRRLNFGKVEMVDARRECRECHRSDALAADGDICQLCDSLGTVSKSLVEKDVFYVVPEGSDINFTEERSLPLPFGCGMVVTSRKKYLEIRPNAKRVYTKNSWDAGIKLATHIWMGDYAAPMEGRGISAYASCGVKLDEGKGIKRLGVLRADVDDLGATFVSGIPSEKASISRTATLSRSLSYFFKYEINRVLECGGYQLQIIYSGGDDLFIVGNWNDVLYAAIDINRAFKEFTGNGCLTISAGVGMFDEKYPIARMAYEVGLLEDSAKQHERKDEDGMLRSKDAVALWTEDSVFGWEELTEVVEPRMREVSDIFKKNEKGKSFIYRIIGLLRDFDNVSSAPRLAYLLARSFEDDKDNADVHCRKFYDWAMDDEQRRCLVAAMEWYVYSIRERG